MNAELVGIIFILSASLIAACGAIFFKKGAEKIKITNKYLILGIIFYVISTVLYITGLKRGQLSVLYPFSSTTYLWVSLFSTKFLGEKMNKFKGIGITFIILGVIIINIV